MQHFMARKNPQQKAFKLPWGSGVVEEEVQIEAKYHMPTVQLLRFTEGQAKGTLEVRFCHYDHEGRFQRSPLIVDAHDLPGLGRALRKGFRQDLNRFLHQSALVFRSWKLGQRVGCLFI